MSFGDLIVTAFQGVGHLTISLVPLVFVTVAVLAVALSVFVFFWSFKTTSANQPYVVSAANFGTTIVYTMSLSAYLVMSGGVSSAPELLEFGPYNLAYLPGGVMLIIALVGLLLGGYERRTAMWDASGIDPNNHGGYDGRGDCTVRVAFQWSFPANMFPLNVPAVAPTGVGTSRFTPRSTYVPLHRLRQPAAA